jgi:hypothetical protein
MNDRRELERKLEQTKRLSMLAGDFTDITLENLSFGRSGRAH